MTKAEKRSPAPRRRWLALPAAAAFAAALAIAGGAPAQDLHSKLEQKKSQLDQANAREGVLSTTIQQYGDELDRIRGEVAALRNQQATLQVQLEQKEAELQRVEQRLAVLRTRLARSLKVLRTRLVAIYESNQPDTLTVILDAKGFDDLLSRADYLGHVQSQDAEIAARVRNLRNETKDAVVRVRAARDAIAAKKADLEATQRQLEARQGDLMAARAKHQQVLSRVQANQHRLEGDVSNIQGEIQAQLRAAAAAAAARARAQAQAEASQAAAPAPPPAAPPTGPVQDQSSSGFIWPVNGPITSPFCESRPWEACHPGIDISVPSGTPIHAAAAGAVAIAGPESGYGNYTCIDHGGGISTCYGHQESISVSVGQHVSQGQVIGLSDCTGLCFGPHLHFEVRLNGQPVDPMSYLP